MSTGTSIIIAIAVLAIFLLLFKIYEVCRGDKIRKIAKPSKYSDKIDTSTYTVEKKIKKIIKQPMYKIYDSYGDPKYSMQKYEKSDNFIKLISGTILSSANITYIDPIIVDFIYDSVNNKINILGEAEDSSAWTDDDIKIDPNNNIQPLETVEYQYEHVTSDTIDGYFKYIRDRYYKDNMDLKQIIKNLNLSDCGKWSISHNLCMDALDELETRIVCNKDGDVEVRILEEND